MRSLFVDVSPSLRLILASASPRRSELLQRIGIPFTVSPADIDESIDSREKPEEFAVRLSKEKGQVIAERNPDAVVLSADTVVVLPPQVMGKPASAEEANSMLSRLSGKTHTVITAFSLRSVARGVERSRLVATEVTLRNLTSVEINAYIATGEANDKAGAYAIQGIGALLVSSVRGSVTNIIGLPLSEVYEELSPLWNLPCR